MYFRKHISTHYTQSIPLLIQWLPFVPIVIQPTDDQNVADIARQFVGSIITSSITECVISDVSFTQYSDDVINMQVTVVTEYYNTRTCM